MHRAPALRAACLVALLSTACLIPTPALASTPAIKPEPAIRALWNRLLHQTSKYDAYLAFAGLDQVSAEGGAVEVLQQGLALAAEDPQAAQMAIPSLYIPMLRLDGSVVLRAAVPMLDSTDPAQREQAEVLLEVLLRAWQPRWISNDDIRDYLKEHFPQPPERFVELLSYLSPSTALLSIDAAYSNPDRHREIIWADHVIADAIWKQEHDFVKAEDTRTTLAELDKLSKFDEWWVCLYVVEIMKKHRFLRDERVLELLRRDKHDFVRQAARREE